MKKTIVLGISSSISAYKVVELAKLLIKDGQNVEVIMTSSATRIISPNKIERVTGNKAYINIFSKNFRTEDILKNQKVDHIDLADRGDLFVIVPGTANIIGKLANGVADDYLTTAALAISAPIILCPSMNVNMWNHPIVQDNIHKLKKIGYQIIEPVEGKLACGYEGNGRLAEIQFIKNQIDVVLSRINKLKNKKILITAGGTVERIDDVRFIGNRSSGKMGVALAEECYLLGADVLLLRAKNSVSPRYLITEKQFSTVDELSNLIKLNIKKFDYIFHTAAVSDFKVENKYSGKILSSNSRSLNLIPQIKIIDQIKKINPKIKLIAFKAESGINKDTIIKTKKKMKKTNADFIVLNDISKTDRGFESDYNEVIIYNKNGVAKKIPLVSKSEIAKKIISYTIS
ncbi:MAG: Phosphopantothenoylcysteine decarboxylase/phosphopantothenate/cysteine ligase [Candidatus Roizmanbacteria bacterium GW2011_GWA2_35_19]|uniref:Coenzyme A biosynthesis bifunctional protein CoaBC n=2 Tax=Candidatus Roizmaniibacteriota TaxID=1752723 RepID=A0A0G0EC50_9BACT|nr:MAG: Phosphopantothenoylcysteine decarboxylase/phosphopantothenate/cysteine ligase [Candidatus Roizmanbacteria bacterium GW2011_GWC2_35_12]KKP72815.1 MAG: Phosphopantothenoylcysteine decarboxylase/phosphopantothenate/cysteine ligase [Candidatus Roizmanbacteria bacterium GW2011_GWA2_35_19]